MPELPEVETVRRGLEPSLAGARLTRVELRRPNLRFPFAEGFAQALEGCCVIALSRRAKYLLMRLEGGPVVIMHLGMSGRFTLTPALSAYAPGAAVERGPVGEFVHDTGTNPRHDHVVLETEGGARIVYNDPRRFGFMVLTNEVELDSHPLIASLGPEPLGNEFHDGYLAGKAWRRTADLKAFLMDQKTVAGLGNIYVCEALHRAGLSPKRAASSLATKTGKPTQRAVRLLAAIRGVLDEAIAAGGSTLRDYAHADGSLGYFQHAFSVYGREGMPCLKTGCRGTVRRIVQSGRSTFFCSRCQN